MLWDFIYISVFGVIKYGTETFSLLFPYWKTSRYLGNVLSWIFVKYFAMDYCPTGKWWKIGRHKFVKYFVTAFKPTGKPVDICEIIEKTSILPPPKSISTRLDFD